MLLTLREELIAAKVSEERAAERMAVEVGLARSQQAAEQRALESVERKLSAEVDELRRRCQHTDRYKMDLEEERAKRKQLEESDKRWSHDAEAARVERQKMESKVAEMKNKIGNLQVELDNSVAVQTDFVRLSQSLQIELEKIRQCEKEVRWQHEDDVSSCQSCKTGLSANRRKHHCRHCGRIFCSDCVTKNVAGGPTGRLAKVCDVCHTLLVQNSAPYFSTEVPHHI
jgi:Rab GTPase-binding effector protein 1